MEIEKRIELLITYLSLSYPNLYLYCEFESFSFLFLKLCWVKTHHQKDHLYSSITSSGTLFVPDVSFLKSLIFLQSTSQLLAIFLIISFYRTTQESHQCSTVLCSTQEFSRTRILRPLWTFPSLWKDCKLHSKYYFLLTFMLKSHKVSPQYFSPNSLICLSWTSEHEFWFE